MKTTPLTGNIGAEISGVRLGELDAPTFREIARALWAHQVLVFRGQDIDSEQQIAFGRRFGELHVHPAFSGVDGHPEILLIRNEGKAKTITEVWHSDVSCDERPPSISVLRAVEVPSKGGDTLWASQYAALESLSEGMRQMLEPLRAVHRKFDLEATHPVLRTHPETGRRALYVNQGFTESFEHMTPQESRPLLNYLVGAGSRPELTMRHRWQPADVVVWDNRCVMHYAVHDYGDAPREMHRVTVRGERPM
ncbi:MAG: TauD/TfdA family dioxygenase [Gammaproteobacteria bacterium]|nr:TauD/TfdA family dioxygenase [Gammaproteobacteria bacterium]